LIYCIFMPVKFNPSPKLFLMKPGFFIPVLFFVLSLTGFVKMQQENSPVRMEYSFNEGWRFHQGDTAEAQDPGFDDSNWRQLDLPHDWSIEGMFSKDHPATPGGGALPGGSGWYRKFFILPDGWEGKKVFIDFDGVYQDSEVWINGHSLGRRPNGYISFRYELTSHLHLDGTGNTVAVRVDNSQQPNSRWYSGSGIYRDVRLVLTDPVHVDHWGTFVTTPVVNDNLAEVHVVTQVRNSMKEALPVEIDCRIFDEAGREVAVASHEVELAAGQATPLELSLQVENPELWSVDNPALYCLVTEIMAEGVLRDRHETPFGIRYFEFDAVKGFSLNGVPMKLKGVCNHHDLGALGAAAYTRAMERQLELLKEMGCNAIRTSHNPPSPVLLDLCDRMGFLVMDETFDMWKMKKTDFDYHLYWDEWHERDLADHIRRDRNHPSVIMWSIGNEIIEQWDDSGEEMAIELAGMVRALDPTRPVTSGCNETSAGNPIMRSGALDIIGFNYHLDQYRDVPVNFPGMPFIASETTSALATRGYYDMPSGGIRIWPLRYDSTYAEMNTDHTCSAYDNCHVPWGSTHEAALMEVNRSDFISGMFVWTGFDYLGEPTPYGWPSRSSYFGILDLAGFPKDAYYLYQSQWTRKPVLHLFPHWNREEGDTVDVWVYSSCREVELFLNGSSQGVKEKPQGTLHMQWRIPYTPGRLEARGSFNGQELRAVVETTGEPAGIRLTADRAEIDADPMDLSFVTVEIVDSQGRVVPTAGNEVRFKVEGEGEVIAVDNGLQTSMEPFRAMKRSAFNGLCLAIVKSSGKEGKILLTAQSDGLQPASLEIDAKQQ
jgi:beta-galactosidase